MAPPWVTFDSIDSFGGDCANASEPDIAGIGVCGKCLGSVPGLHVDIQVVLSFIIASFMTTFASILAMMLDQAFDTKGHFRPRAPFRYIRERFLENEWKKHYAWRPFLDPLIIGFGDQQLITGYAVLLSGWIKVWSCLLSASSYSIGTRR